MLKFSRQRESIKECLMNRYDHPTAEMIYLSLKEKYPNISLGTVYRNLALLAELGEIRKISTGVAPDRFDGHLEPHHHVLCTSCGCVMDLKIETPDNIIADANKEFPGIIEGYELQFYGKCPDCMHKLSS